MIAHRSFSRGFRTLCRLRAPMDRDPMNNSNSYDGPGKTTVSILNQEVGFLMIDGYSLSGFRLNNNAKAFGPIALFPSCVLSWGVSGPHDINERTLRLFSLVHPKPDLIILGLGDYGNVMDGQTFMKLRSMGLNIETLSTENAVSTYNYLCAEGRAVCAGLIPPDMKPATSDDDHFVLSQTTRNPKMNLLE